MLKYWNKIPLENKKNFKGISCRCYDPETGKILGPTYKESVLDVSELDAKFIYGFRFDLWGISRTQVLKNKFPELLGGQKSGLIYYPETIYWNNLSRHYMTRYINEALDGYYKDREDALTGKTIRAKENRYLWLHYINETNDYFNKYYPMLFIKACVGLARDSYILSGISGALDAIATIKTKWMKFLYLVLLIPGIFLGMRYLHDKK